MNSIPNALITAEGVAVEQSCLHRELATTLQRICDHHHHIFIITIIIVVAVVVLAVVVIAVKPL